jgi:amino acid permease
MSSLTFDSPMSPQTEADSCCSILGIILDCGGGPQGKYIGGSNWHNPGAFNYGFKGLCSTFVTAAFAFSGTELVGLAAAETADPRKSLPRAVKQVFWRISLVSYTYRSRTCYRLLIKTVLPHLTHNHRGSGPLERPTSPEWREFC